MMGLVEMEFKKSKILVVGDVMVDYYIYGSAERDCPEAPVKILEKEKEENFLGGAGVVAANLRNLGAEVRFVSVIGDDSSGKHVLELCRNTDVPTDFVVVEKQRKTTLKTRFMATKPEFKMCLRVDDETRKNVSKETEEKIVSKIEKLAKETEYVIISDYNKGLLTRRIRDALLATGRKIIVDSKQNLREYKGAYVFVPNMHEFCIAAGIPSSNDDKIIIPNAIRLQKELGGLLVVKRSERGATVIDLDGQRSFPSVAKKVLNVSGAGDIFLSVLTMALASGKSIDDSVKLANLGCAKAIAKRHPSISLDDLNESSVS